MNTFLHRQPFGLRAVGAVADQQQLGRNFLAHAVENLDHIENAFDRPEVGKVHQQAFVVRNIFDSVCQPFRFAHVFVAVHEVRDDFDVVLDVENIQRAVAQVLRDRRNAIALLDRKTRNRQIGTIEPDESDVGAMQSRNKRQDCGAAE